jgi:hypothetical protein
MNVGGPHQGWSTIPETHAFPPAPWARWVGAAVEATSIDRDVIATQFVVADTEIGVQPCIAQALAIVGTAAAGVVRIAPASDLDWNTRLLQEAIMVSH